MGSGRTLIGDRVIGVRMTFLSGSLVGRWVLVRTGGAASIVAAGSCGGGSAGGGSGGFGVGGGELGAVAVGVMAGAVEVTETGRWTSSAWPRNTNRTPDTTIAAAAPAVAISAVIVDRARYQGAAAGWKSQVVASKASNSESRCSKSSGPSRSATQRC